jgi:hypothetical protein
VLPVVVGMLDDVGLGDLCSKKVFPQKGNTSRSVLLFCFRYEKYVNKGKL